MHIEVQVALNFVISYLYNKLPRRRVNIFGEELEKALKDKFQGHWYPDKPFKGSAFRCLKTGDPIDAVLERAARESGLAIQDILENLPNELSVWVDPGEVSYRIGEKSTVKVLYTENNDNLDDANSADCEVNKTFNPEAQCFRPIDLVNNGMNGLSLSPKTHSSYSGSSPLSACSISPIHYKGSPNMNNLGGGNGGSGNGAYMVRQQAPLQFTTASFAATKFGSTKLKTNSKRANNSYRMSPTEFSNYIKQRAMQQQQHQHHPHQQQQNGGGNAGGGHHQPNQQHQHFHHHGSGHHGVPHSAPVLGHPYSPRSHSPNSMSLAAMAGHNGGDPFYFPTGGLYQPPQQAAYGQHQQQTAQQQQRHHLFDSQYSNEAANCLGFGKFGGSNGFLDPHVGPFYGNGFGQQQQQLNGDNYDLVGLAEPPNNKTSITVTVSSADCSTTSNGCSVALTSSPGSPAPSLSNCGSGICSSSDTSSSSNDSPPPSPANASSSSAASSPGDDKDSGSGVEPVDTSKQLIDGLQSFYGNANGSYHQLLVAN